LYKYNLANHTLTKTDYKLTSPAGKADGEFVVNMENQIYFFMSATHTGSKKHILYAQTLNKKTMQLSGTPVKLMELSYQGEAKSRPISFRYALSPDKTKLVVVMQLSKKGEVVRSGFTVFDKELKQLWQSNEVSTGIEADFTITDFDVDNNGNVFYCGGTLPDDDMSKKDKKQFTPRSFVVMMNEQNKEPNPVEITFGTDKCVRNIILGISPDNEVFCAGILTKKRMHNGLGVFAAKINTETGSVSNVSIDEFDEKFLTEGLKPAEVKKIANKLQKGENFESYTYYLDDIQFLKNGTLLLSAAKRFYTVIQTRDRSVTIYHFGDIVLANFDANGSFLWKQKVAREVDVVNYPLWGHHGILTDDNNNIHVCYNLVSSSAFIGVNFLNKTQTIHVTIDADGKSEWETLHETKIDKVTARPWEMSYINDTDEILLPGSKGATTLTFTTFRFNK
jgi:hypothetical protein